MDAQELRNLQEAYIEVYQNLDEEGATSKRLADVADDRIGGLPRTHHIHHRRGTASLRTLSNLHFNAKERAQGRYPEKSGLRRGAGGAGVPDRPGDSVTSLGDTRRGAARKLLDLEANRKKPLTPSERPIPIRSRPTPPTSGPTSRTNTPLTPKIRDQRAAAAGFSGQGSLPKGPKLARQTARGVTTGDDPMKVLQSAAQQKEHYDLYDIILSHLLDEGYADTQEAAEVIMVNMSEDWRESICEELTGERRKRALEKGTPLATRVATGREGQPVERRKRSGDITMRTTTKAPTKRGGGGEKGQRKADWSGWEADRGS